LPIYDGNGPFVIRPQSNKIKRKYRKFFMIKYAKFKRFEDSLSICLLIISFFFSIFVAIF
jgi:hypothetical protein